MKKVVHIHEVCKVCDYCGCYRKTTERMMPVEKDKYAVREVCQKCFVKLTYDDKSMETK